MEFRRVLGFIYSSVLIKTWLQQRPFLQNFRDEIIPTRYVQNGFLFCWQPTIFLRKKLFVDVGSDAIVENIKFETPWLWLSILVKKTLLLGMHRKLSFPLKVSENISEKQFVLKLSCYKILGLQLTSCISAVNFRLAV